MAIVVSDEISASVAEPEPGPYLSPRENEEHSPPGYHLALLRALRRYKETMHVHRWTTYETATNAIGRSREYQRCTLDCGLERVVPCSIIPKG